MNDDGFPTGISFFLLLEPGRTGGAAAAPTLPFSPFTTIVCERQGLGTGAASGIVSPSGRITGNLQQSRRFLRGPKWGYLPLGHSALPWAWLRPQRKEIPFSNKNAVRHSSAMATFVPLDMAPQLCIQTGHGSVE